MFSLPLRKHKLDSDKELNVKQKRQLCVQRKCNAEAAFQGGLPITVQMKALLKQPGTHFARRSPLILKHPGPCEFLGQCGHYTNIPIQKEYTFPKTTVFKLPFFF